MRCPDCNKFVPNGEPEVEIQSGEDLDAEIFEGKLIIKCQPEIRVMIPCGECGAELKEANLLLEMEYEHECDKLPKEEPADGIEIQGDLDVEPIDEYKTKDRKGKPITNPRYQTHLYGAEVTARTVCPFCGEAIEFSQSDTVDASGMDELV